MFNLVKSNFCKCFSYLNIFPLNQVKFFFKCMFMSQENCLEVVNQIYQNSCEKLYKIVSMSVYRLYIFQTITNRVSFSSYFDT